MTRIVGERVRDRLPKDIGGHPSHAIRVLLRHHARKPVANARIRAEGIGVVIWMALQVDAPMTRERNEQYVAKSDARMLVMKNTLEREKLEGIFGDVDDDVRVGGSWPLEMQPR